MIHTRCLIGLILLILAGCSSGEKSGAQAHNEGGKGSAEALKIAGEWFSEMDGESPLIIRVAEKGVAVEWKPTFEMEVEIVGLLQPEGDNRFAGQVEYSLGGVSGTKDLALISYPGGDGLDMEFPTLFSQPVPFTRTQSPWISCAVLAESLVMNSDDFRALLPDDRLAKIMPETDSEHTDVFAYRAYESNEDEEMVTLARYQVNIGAKQVLKYDPAEDEYIPLPGSEAWFEGRNCK